jgi:hypothetical protein
MDPPDAQIAPGKRLSSDTRGRPLTGIAGEVMRCGELRLHVLTAASGFIAVNHLGVPGGARSKGCSGYPSGA